MASNENPPPKSRNAQEAMEAACLSGDVAALQQLLQEAGVRPRNPLLSHLFDKAVAAKQVEIVKFLLAFDDSQYLIDYGTCSTLIENPNAEIAQLICQRYPELPDTDRGDRQTYFEVACAKPPSIAPVLHVFLDNGADLSPYHVQLSIAHAVESQQPMDVMTKMVAKAERIDTFALNAAIRSQRPDLVELFLGHPHIDNFTIDDGLCVAKETGNREILAMVRACRNKRKWWRPEHWFSSATPQHRTQLEAKTDEKLCK